MKFSGRLQILLLLVILGFSAFLLLFRLNELMQFIGDQAWFYLSARDIWLKGEIPLVGITASHTWLHQGAVWTYILALLLPLGKFNPVIPAYFSIFMTLFTSGLLYLISKKLFGTKAAFITTALFALSPLIIMHARMPYHTSLIPLFSLLFFFCTYLWIKGNEAFFPLMFFLLGILYNLELASAMLWAIPVLLLTVGFYKKTFWYKKVIRKKIILLSLIAIIVPMIPVLLYDMDHGYLQTIVFAGWIGYKAIASLIPLKKQVGQGHFWETFVFLYRNNSTLLFPLAPILAAFLTVLATIMGISDFRKKFDLGLGLLLLFFVVFLLGFILNQTPSEAYLPLFFPFMTLLIGRFLAIQMRSRLSTTIVILGVSSLVFANSLYLLSNSYFSSRPLSMRIQTAHEIVDMANGRQFSLVAHGEGQQFANTKLNTEYLTWWLGGNPRSTPQHLQFIVSETKNTISLQKKE